VTEADREELQRLAQLVEANRERLQAIEQQMRSLENIRIEQMHAIEALEAISQDGAKGTMVPLGAGVQLIADIPADAGAVVDMGSRVQAEKTRAEAIEILRKRNQELEAILETVKREYDETESQIATLANMFNETVERMEPEGEPPATESPEEGQAKPRPRSRRKRGTELTLDD
tara:strand:+ start:643 stop:1164 length:522 start_codon:yes stop_codon:yes gene_type:complete